MNSVLSFDCDRRYGTEFEILAFDGRNFKTHPLERGESPAGMDYVANVIMQTIKKPVSIHKWHLTHNNNDWLLKPDSSCGIEICSPILKGTAGLLEASRVTNAMRKHRQIKADNRCGFHVHIDVGDCTTDEVAKILTYWVKCETLFLDSVPSCRRKNRYCQQTGITELFDVEVGLSPQAVIEKLGLYKYHTMNSYHIYRKHRDTLEVRIIEGEGCLDPFLVKNWTRLLVHFVDQVKLAAKPGKYEPGNQWSSFCWLDPKEMMELLGFMKPLSTGLTETRNWFLARLKLARNTASLQGVFSKECREFAWKQVDELWEMFQLPKDPMEVLRPENIDEAIEKNRH